MPHPKIFVYIRFLVAPSHLSELGFWWERATLPLSVNCCVPSFDKFCYTRIQVSVKDLDPSIILQSLNECKKEIERYRHESLMSSGLWLHGLFVSETEFPIYTSSFQAAFYVLMLPTLLPVFVYCFGYFVLQIMSQVQPGGIEGICCRTVLNRPYWNWSVLAHDYLVVIYYSVYAFVSRW